MSTSVSRPRVLVVLLASLLSVVTSLVPQPASATEVDGGIVELKKVLGDAAEWTSGLAEAGKLAEKIPTVGRSAGSVLGFPDLVQKAVADRAAGIQHWDDLEDELGTESLTLGSGRTGKLLVEHDEADGTHTVDLTLQVSRTESDQPFNSANADPKLNLSSSGGVEIKAALELKLSLVVEKHENGVSYTPYVKRESATNPGFSVDVEVKLPHTAPGLSAAVGILGVTAVEADDEVDASIHLVGSVADPDGDGRLYVTRPNGADGELKDLTAAAGLFSVGFKSGDAGSVDIDLVVAAKADTSFSLPAVNGTVSIAWPNLATGSPDVDLTGFDLLEAFQSISPRDLADMLGQLATLITGAQRNPADNLKLPFLSGSLADAVKGAEGLLDFLKQNVAQPPAAGAQQGIGASSVDPATIGEPAFRSLQDLVKKLDDFSKTTKIGGLTFAVTVGQFDSVTKRLPLELKMTRAGKEVDLVETTVAVSGTASYSDTTLTDAAGKPFAAELVGRRVTAGASGGTIAKVDGATLTLTDDGWVGGRPPTGASYAVSGADVDAGAVNLGNLLGEGSGGTRKQIGNANAVRPTAKVTPSYEVLLKFALDLSAPRTGDKCTGGPEGAPCPYTRTNADGTKTIIPSEPLGVERLLVGTDYDLISADFPMTAGIDVFAKAGFLGVQLGGSVKLCSTADKADCSDNAAALDMLTLKLKKKPTDPDDGYVPIAAMFTSLVSTPGDRLDFTTQVRAQAKGDVSVPGSADFLGENATAGFTVGWDDLVKNPTKPTTTQVSDLSEVFDFDLDASNPQALLGIVIRVLQLVDDQLREGDDGGVLGAKIPLVDKSVRDLLGSDESGGGLTVTYTSEKFDTTPGTDGGDIDVVRLKDVSRGTPAGGQSFTEALVGRSIVVGTQVAVVLAAPEGGQELLLSKLPAAPTKATPYSLSSELADAIALISANPPDSLQKLVSLLDDRLGNLLGVKGLAAQQGVKFKTRKIGNPAKSHLVMNLDWGRAYSVSTPVKLDLGSSTLAGVKGSGTASVSVKGDLDLDLAVPLELPASLTSVPLKVLDTTQVNVEANAKLAGAFGANLGPLSMSLGDPKDGGTKAKAEARYSLGFAGKDGDGPKSLTDFFKTVAPVVNGYDGSVSCDNAPGGDALALCASLPMYVSTNGKDYTPLTVASAPNDPLAIALRLPKTGATQDALFKLTGPVSGNDARLRLTAPTTAQLQEAFSSTLLDFGMIGDGLDAFLLAIEDALKAASMEGKLPVVGDDLQAGSDFVGKVREQVDKLFTELEGVNGGKLPDAAQIGKYLDEKFQQALKDAGANPTGFELVTTCKLPAATGAKATFAGTTAADTDYTYAVVATGSLGGSTVDTAPSDEVVVKAPATFAASGDAVTVEWTKVDNATGYKVIRQDGSDWKVVGTATADETSLVDATGKVSGQPYEPVGDVVVVDSCSGVQATGIEGIVLRVDIGAGTVDATEGCKGTGCIETDIPLDIGVPGLALRRSRGEDGVGGVKAKVGWKVHLAFSLDRSDGFSILTKDQGLPELGVGLNIDLVNNPQTGTALGAELAFLKIDVSKANGTNISGTPPALAASFQVDINSGKDGDDACYSGNCPASADHKLGLPELLGAQAFTDIVKPRLDVNLAVDWLLKASVDSSFPGVQTRLEMTWKKVLTTQDVGDLDQDFTIAFQDVALDAGAFLTQVLGPIVKQIKDVTGPVQPIIDTLYAPIPVLSDLSELAGGPPVTLVTLAKSFSTLAGGPDLSFVDTVAGVISFVNNLPTPKDGVPLLIPIGQFLVDSSDAFAVQATPDSGRKLIKERKYKKNNGDGTYTTTTNESDAKPKEDIDSKSTKPALTSQQGKATSVATGAGFTFPLLDNPGQLFNLVMGGDVTLVEFDSGNLGMAFTWRQAFGPVYAPPPVFITMSGTASVTARIVAGFDTYGLRKAFEAGFTGGSAFQILNGLYFKSTDDAGNPLPVITLYGEIAAGAAVSAVIITVGVEGGVSLTVHIAWNDPDNDGKFRLFEFGQVALRNPVCLFQMSGRLGLFLRVYITLGISPFSVSFDFTLADITLLDFSLKPDCEPEPPRLGGVTKDGTTLVVFAGKLGTGGIRGDKAWDNAGQDDEVVKVTQLHTYAGADGAKVATKSGVKVDMLGISETWTSSTISRVVVDGRGYDKSMKVTFLGDGDKSKSTSDTVATGGFTMDAVVVVGGGDDVVKVGSGRSLIDTGAGNDTVSASDTPDAVSWIAGGPGNDSITTGNADAVAAGDSGLGGSSFGDLELTRADGADPATVTVPGIVNWDTLVAPSDTEASGDGNDRLAVGRGANQVYGGGGNDQVGVAADSQLPNGPKADKNLIVLGTGADTAKAGNADDTIWTGPKTDQTRVAPEPDGDGGADTGLRNVVETGAGSDTVFGGSQPDFITTGSTAGQSAVVAAGAGNDVVTGGLGADQLFGGAGQDWVVAEPAAVGSNASDDGQGPQLGELGTLARTYAKSALPSPAPNSAKVLAGGDGADRVIGGDGPSTIYGDRVEAACQVPASGQESAQPDEPSAGSPGRDLITGGEGVDKVRAGGQADKVTAFGGDDLLCGQAGHDEVYAGDGADKVWAGSGDDRAYGDAGADSVYGNDGGDQLYGGVDNDVLEGNNGADRAYGGSEADQVLGGSRAEGVDDSGGDQLYGDAGMDTLIGDNGSGTQPYDLDGSKPAAGAGDALYGGTEDDRAFGGLGGDTILGGVGDDHLEGNNGADTVYGEVGEDELVGGSNQATGGVGRPDGGDVLEGGDGPDVLVGDNADVGSGTPHPLTQQRAFTGSHAITLLDLAAPETNAGGDTLRGQGGFDVLLGQGGIDKAYGGDGDDYAEGGPNADEVYGEQGQDDLVGGSYTRLAGASQPDAGDLVHGGGSGDVVLGDNGTVLRTGTVPLVEERGITHRSIAPYDTADGVVATLSGADTLEGQGANDVLLGQGGNDVAVRGNDGDDYAEGGQGADLVEGNDGVDDLVGGSYFTTGTGQGLLDGADTVSGGSGDDVALGDNGAVLRVGAPSPLVTGRTMTARSIAPYDTVDTALATRSGADTLTGEAATDVLLGQGGDDVAVRGNGGDDYAEGGQGADLVEGNDGVDDLVGGSYFTTGADQGLLDGGDRVYGGAGDDVALGDNGAVLRSGTVSPLVTGRGMTDRSIAPYDTVVAALPTRSGPDDVRGEDATDVLLGQDGTDTVRGGDADDYAEGGQARDWIEGNDGTDDLVGGSYFTTAADTGLLDEGDVVLGGGGDDVVAGDNARVLRGTSSQTNATKRSGSTGALTPREVTLLDRGLNVTTHNPGTRSGGDRISGGDGVDVVWGQDGGDRITGNGGEDYVEGNGGADVIRGDLALAQLGGADFPAIALPAVGDPAWPGVPSVGGQEGSSPEGQDDLIGGSSAKSFRDEGDTIKGDGAADVVLGDNGTLLRQLVGGAEQRYTDRFPSTTPLEQVTKVRVTDESVSKFTRLCETVKDRLTCEVSGAFGGDSLYGDAGDDGIWAQDGNDVVRGGDDRDDLFGELGDDRVFGDAGEDVLLGDRGGVQNKHLTDGNGVVDAAIKAAPMAVYQGRTAGTYDRLVDLQNETDAGVLQGTSKTIGIPYPGQTAGGRDRLRGGTGNDQLHAGAGDDLANGDSGGDEVWGGDGADALWGGRGCDGAAECGALGAANPGANKEFIDHVFGGKSGAASTAWPTGADVMDWAPRPLNCTSADWPSSAGGKKGSVTLDPCSWQDMTSETGKPDRYQSHQGVDWHYGGWGRDVMEGDQAFNGPNEGDRLFDWTGVYNLYAHCNSAYGGYNDIRLWSPEMQLFLQKLAFGAGAGRDASDAVTPGTSAFAELAMVYQSDLNAQGSGTSFPSTPGNFSDVHECAK
jgi:Ca2+-binding RTX toxin-like protein